MNATARQLLAEVARLGAAINRAHYELRRIMWLAESTETASSSNAAGSVALLERAR